MSTPLHESRNLFRDEDGKLLFEENPPVYKETREFWRCHVDENGVSVYEERHARPVSPPVWDSSCD